MSNWNYYVALNSDAQMLVSAEFIEGNKTELCCIYCKTIKRNVENVFCLLLVSVENFSIFFHKK